MVYVTLIVTDIAILLRTWTLSDDVNTCAISIQGIDVIAKFPVFTPDSVVNSTVIRESL